MTLVLVEQAAIGINQEWLDEWLEFTLGCDPAWHEHKGNIKQEDD